MGLVQKQMEVGIGVKKTGPTNFMAIKNYGGLPFAKLSLFSTKVQSSARALTAWDGVQKWEKKTFFHEKKNHHIETMVRVVVRRQTFNKVQK